MTIYSPIAFIFTIFLPLIVILYLLKQQHEDYPIPSIFLWQKALKDIEANAPWQKLRNNILMILQLLAMALLIFALSKPFIQAKGFVSQELVLVLDVSASMQAKDISPNRFEVAKKELLKVIENSKPNTRFTVLSMGAKTKIEVNKTNDKSTAINESKKIKVTNGAVNSEETKSILQSIKSESENVQVIVFSDRYDDVLGDVEFVNSVGDNDNSAVVLVSYTKQQDKIIGLSRIANYSRKDKKLSLSLYGDEKVIDAKDISLKPGETRDIYWNDIPIDTTLLSCEIEQEDDIDADNIARTVINKERQRKVLLVTDKNLFLEKALLLIPGLELFKTNENNTEIAEGYDLYIYDGLLPEKLPDDGNIFLINPPSGDNLIRVSPGYKEIAEIEQSDHPLMEHIQNDKFSISKARDINTPQWGDIVLKSENTPLIIAGEVETQKVIIVGFDLHQTDLPLKSAFPIMVSNFVNWLTPSTIHEIENVLPYEPVVLSTDPETEGMRVITPSGKSIDVAPPFPVLPFTQSEEIGFYAVEHRSKQDEKYHFFAVDFPVSLESFISDTENIGVEDKVKDSSKKSFKIGYDLTWIIILLALAVLIVEWWVYNYGD